MDILPDSINFWLVNYGSLALFGLLALGIIALPIPEETLLMLSGVLICEGTFSLFPTLVSAYLGSIIGITGSYLIGSTGGHYIVNKYGSYFGLNENKMSRAHHWFERYGKWFLVIGYFIPGVRHFTGIFAGISSLKFHHFALYAYTGALLWILTFVSVGYFFGTWHQEAIEFIESNVELLIITSVAIISLVIFLKIKTKK